ncbi:MAG TPA: hypothetical protein VN688_18340 [Gemmataceae bacterium]|nr:hypothetical protein [Gemmataceae bacterium]
MMIVPAWWRWNRRRPARLLALLPLLGWLIGCAALVRGQAPAAETAVPPSAPIAQPDKGQINSPDLWNKISFGSPNVQTMSASPPAKVAGPSESPLTTVASPVPSPTAKASPALGDEEKFQKLLRTRFGSPQLPPPTLIPNGAPSPPPLVLPEPGPPPPVPVEPILPPPVPVEPGPPAAPPGPTFLVPEPAAPVPLFAPPALESGLPVGGCASCGGGAGASDVRPAPPADACACGIGGCGCIPGRNPCYSCNATTHVGRFMGALYECLCCPDPCYEPRWIAAANSSFFTDPARPISQTRVRYDSGLGLQFPDRAEYFWARADGKGRGPSPVAPHLGEGGLNYNQLSLYTEVAIKKFSFFTEIPYLSINPNFDPFAAGFGNMNLGTKSLLFDCELLQFTFQFRTYIPIGSSAKGLSNGHVTLEPSVLMALKLGPETYLQGQIGEWIPIGGDPNYQGSILQHHLSLNHVLWRIMPDVPLIGTLEYNGLSFQTGSFTDPILGPFQKGGAYTFVSMGPGLRLVICNRVDIGVGAAFAVTEPTYPRQLYRTEFRWRF